MMQDLKFTIQEYETSYYAIQTRIHEINAEIAKANTGKSDNPVKCLLERRSIMYTELCGIQYALHELCEYQKSLGREVNLKIV